MEHYALPVTADDNRVETTKNNVLQTVLNRLEKVGQCYSATCYNRIVTVGMSLFGKTNNYVRSLGCCT